MKPTLLKEEYQIFKNNYEKNSGLHLPMEYLENSDVYIFKRKNLIVGGFVLGKKNPLRTVDVFISKDNHKQFSHYFSSNKFCEICCFWIDRNLRKRAYYNAKFWLMMAYTIKKQEKEFILFGTNSGGLAKMYGLPKNSLLLHKDKINNKDTFVFLGRRKDIMGGIWEIVKSKLLKRNRNTEFEKKEILKKTLIYEVSK